MSHFIHSVKFFLIALVFFLLQPQLVADNRGVESGERYDRLVIRDVIIIDGKGAPPRGPVVLSPQPSRWHRHRSCCTHGRSRLRPRPPADR